MRDSGIRPTWARTTRPSRSGSPWRSALPLVEKANRSPSTAPTRFGPPQRCKTQAEATPRRVLTRRLPSARSPMHQEGAWNEPHPGPPYRAFRAHDGHRRSRRESGSRDRADPPAEWHGTHEGAMGSSLANAGDVDADGVDDLLVGEPSYSTTVGEVGRLWVYSGRTFTVIRSHDGTQHDES